MPPHPSRWVEHTDVPAWLLLRHGRVLVTRVKTVMAQPWISAAREIFPWASLLFWVSPARALACPVWRLQAGTVDSSFSRSSLHLEAPGRLPGRLVRTCDRTAAYRAMFSRSSLHLEAPGRLPGRLGRDCDRTAAYRAMLDRCSIDPDGPRRFACTPWHDVWLRAIDLLPFEFLG